MLDGEYTVKLNAVGHPTLACGTDRSGHKIRYPK